MIIPGDRNVCVSASIRLVPFVSSLFTGFRDQIFSQKTRSRLSQKDIQLIILTACQRSCGKIMFSVVFICLSDALDHCTIQGPPLSAGIPTDGWLLKHIQWASGRHASYCNAFLLLIFLYGFNCN